jgi:hypothetical protein
MTFVVERQGSSAARYARCKANDRKPTESTDTVGICDACFSKISPIPFVTLPNDSCHLRLIFAIHFILDGSTTLSFSQLSFARADAGSLSLDLRRMHMSRRNMSRLATWSLMVLWCSHERTINPTNPATLASLRPMIVSDFCESRQARKVSSLELRIRDQQPTSVSRFLSQQLLSPLLYFFSPSQQSDIVT